MTDYIKRKDAYKTIKHLLYVTARNNMECAPQFAEACEDIAENRLEGYMSAIPAADVRENVCGHWVVDEKEDPKGVDWCHCSVCGRTDITQNISSINFCPNCGSEMVTIKNKR